MLPTFFKTNCIYRRQIFKICTILAEKMLFIFLPVQLRLFLTGYDNMLPSYRSWTLLPRMAAGITRKIKQFGSQKYGHGHEVQAGH